MAFHRVVRFDCLDHRCTRSMTSAKSNSASACGIPGLGQHMADNSLETDQCLGRAGQCSGWSYPCRVTTQSEVTLCLGRRGGEAVTSPALPAPVTSQVAGRSGRVWGQLAETRRARIVAAMPGSDQRETPQANERSQRTQRRDALQGESICASWVPAGGVRPGYRPTCRSG